MWWCGILDGKIIIHWFEDGVSVNGISYLEILKTVVWPKIRSKVNSKPITFMKDGAPPNWRSEVFDWIAFKFGDNIISYMKARPWPSKSPDLNPLYVLLVLVSIDG